LVIKNKEEIAMAAVILQEISKDEHERARLRSRRMYETDMESDRLTSEEIGEIREREKWQAVVADYKAEITDNKAKLANKDAEIELLRSQIAELKAKNENS